MTEANRVELDGRRNLLDQLNNLTPTLHTVPEVRGLDSASQRAYETAGIHRHPRCVRPEA